MGSNCRIAINFFDIQRNNMRYFFVKCAPYELTQFVNCLIKFKASIFKAFESSLNVILSWCKYCKSQMFFTLKIGFLDFRNKDLLERVLHCLRIDTIRIARKHLQVSFNRLSLSFGEGIKHTFLFAKNMNTL